MAIPLAVLGAVSAVSGVVSSISGVVDADKRRLYEQNFQLLSAEEKKRLNTILLAEKSEESRQQILANTLGTIGSARVNALAVVQAEKEKTKKTLLVVGIIAAVIVIGGLVYLKSKK